MSGGGRSGFHRRKSSMKCRLWRKSTGKERCFCVCLCASLFSVCVVFMSVSVFVCSALLAFSSIMSVYCTFLRLIATVPEVRAPLNDAESLCGHCWLIAPREYDNTIAAVSKCRHNMRNTHPTVSIGSDSVSRHLQYVSLSQSMSRLFPREMFSVFYISCVESGQKKP